MTFLFEDVFTGDLTYVNAPNLNQAIEIFESHPSFSDKKKYHVYIRID